jgi:hypothetical protein
MAVARIAKHRPTLYDDERTRARSAATSSPRPAAQSGSAPIARTGAQGSRR